MAYLSLNHDEIALLRYTCDLAFVEESPFFVFESEAREPEDYAQSYRSLVSKQVIDPYEFRITDAALNRLAPVTECDARLIHLKQAPNSKAVESHYWLLDEIAVELVQGEAGYALGTDLDPMELIEHCARRVTPRKSVGDRLAITLTHAELLVLGVLARASSPANGFALNENEARARLGQEELSEHTVVTRPTALSAVGVRTSDALQLADDADSISMSLIDIDLALAGLIDKGTITLRNGLIQPRPGLANLLEEIRGGTRHTWVRMDFGDGNWLVRETTLFEGAGALYSLRMDDEDLIRLEEVDGNRLRRNLARALGPCFNRNENPATQRVRELQSDSQS